MKLVLLVFLGLAVCCLSQDIPELVITGEHDTLGCVPYMGQFDCRQPMDLGHKDKSKNSLYKIVDDRAEDAWVVVSRKKKGYVGRENEPVTIAITRKDESKSFEMKNICFFTKNALIATFETFAVTPGMVDESDSDQIEIKKSKRKRSKWIKTCLFRKFVLQRFELVVYLDESRPEKQIFIKGMTIKACREHDGNFDATPEPIWNKTRDFCVNQLTLRSPWSRRRPNDYKSFLINNMPWSVDWLILAGSLDPFEAPEGEDVEFEFKAADGNDFEWWQICLETRMADRIDFTLDAKFVIYKENKTICNENVTEWTRICYSPWGRDVIVKKATVKVVLLRSSAATSNRIEIRNVKLDICRDHNLYKFTMHSNPGDYKVMTIETPRNQTVSIFGLKGADGGLQHTEVYHYTDHTGNHGDNTTFTIGTNSLVEKIMTPQDTIQFEWLLSNDKKQGNVLVINVISRNGQFEARMHVDIDKLQVISTEGVENEAPRSIFQANVPEIKKAIVNVKQCNVDARNVFVFGSSELPDSKSPEIARFSGQPGKYEFHLPTKKKPTAELCDRFIQVKGTECKGHAFLDRSRYRFICQQMRLVLLQFTANQLGDRSRIHEACDMAFRTINIVCRATTDSPGPDQKPYHREACDTNAVKFLNKFPKKVDKVKLTPVVRDDAARQTQGEEIQISIPAVEDTESVIEDGNLQYQITTEPNNPAFKGYKLKVAYSCARGAITAVGLPDQININVVGEILDVGVASEHKCNVTSTQGTCELQIPPLQTVEKSERGKQSSHHFKVFYLLRGAIQWFPKDFYVVLTDISDIV